MRSGQPYAPSPAYLASLTGNADVERKRVLDAVTVAGGDITAAAKALDYNARTLRRGIERLGITVEVEKIRAAAGYKGVRDAVGVEKKKPVRGRFLERQRVMG